jgi:hypothetical protein
MGPSASRPISISSASLIRMSWRWPVAGFTAHPVTVNMGEATKMNANRKFWTRFRMRVMRLFPYLNQSCLECSNIGLKYVGVIPKPGVVSS